MPQTVLYHQCIQYTVSLTFTKCIDSKNLAARCNPCFPSFHAVGSVRAIVLFVFFSFSSRAAQNENARYTRQQTYVD